MLFRFVRWSRYDTFAANNRHACAVGLRRGLTLPATASVDPFTDAPIQEGLEALMADRTAIVIAHRLSTVKRADRQNTPAILPVLSPSLSPAN